MAVSTQQGQKAKQMWGLLSERRRASPFVQLCNKLGYMLQPKVLCIPWGTGGKPYLFTVALGESLRMQKNLRVQGSYKLQAIPYNLKS